MIIKSLFEIAFYSSLLVVKKVGATIGDNLPFSTNKKIEPVALRTVKVDLDEAKKHTNYKVKQAKEITPKQEAKIMNYELKTKKELYEIAQEIDLEGRSTMNKAELLKALQEEARK